MFRYPNFLLIGPHAILHNPGTTFSESKVCNTEQKERKIIPKYRLIKSDHLAPKRPGQTLRHDIKKN